MRQGCLLSCYLFNLVGQVLIYYLQDEGFFAWWMKPGDPCSLYADDTAIFIPDTDQLQSILDAITHVDEFTGLALNLEKMIAFSPLQERCQIIAGIQVDSVLVKYLGAFLGLGDLSALNFEMPLRKARIKLQKWNKRKLSLFARITVAKTFIFSLFTHILNSTWITNDQLNLTQKILNEFLWGGENKLKPSIFFCPLD